MSRRREINIFSVSFLDLLSGALAAVIILFIVVPKLDAESKETLQTMEDLELQASELEEMVAQLEHSVDSSVYEEVVAQIEELQAAMQAARENVSQLNQQIEQKQQQVANLNQRVAQQREEVEAQKRRANDAEKEAEDARKQGQLFGVDAEFAIVVQWQQNADIDLYLTNLETGSVCYFANRVTPFGSLLRDETTATGDSYELIYQSRLVPGRYKLSLSLYSIGEGVNSVTANGYMSMYPFTDQEKRVDFRPMVLYASGGTGRSRTVEYVGEFVLPLN